MKQTFLLSLIALRATLSVNLPAVSQETAPETQVTSEDSILEKLKNGSEKTLLFGVEEDEYPISYRESNQWRGFCAEFAGYLEEYLNSLKSKQNSSSSITVRYVNVSKYGRFEGLREQKVHLECGPNTIPKRLEEGDDSSHPRYQNIEFSRPFFVTGTRLLIKKSNKGDVKKNPLFYNERIGVMKNTTTYSIIGNIYRYATRVPPNPNTRKQGILSVGDGTRAYATDSVILEAELEKLVKRDDYYLFPENHFLSSEPYGIAFHKSQKDLLDEVNEVLKTDRLKNIINEELKSKYDSVSKLNRQAQNRAIILLLLKIAVAVLSIAWSWIAVRAGYGWYLNSKTAELTFDQEEEFDWNAFIYAFKTVQIDYNVVLLAINEFGINNSNGLSFQVDLSKTQLKKERFVKTFVAEYESALANLKRQYRQEISEAQAQGQGLEKVQTKYPQGKALNELIDRVSININNLQSSEESEVSNQSSKNYNNNLTGASVGNFAHENSGVQNSKQNNYTSPEKKDLAEAEKKVQQILQQLEENNPADNTSAHMILAAKAVEQIESDPTLKQKVISAVKEGGLAAFERA
ncbi:MAG: transporter substrate-binding domain-containing protein, partial [Moorea sp. SIO3G5]|nr:transporter substrate-binding domain-containing protein [Moorena sp. SIO3G5]